MHADYIIVRLNDLKYLGILRDPGNIGNIGNIGNVGNVGNIDDKH